MIWLRAVRAILAAVVAAIALVGIVWLLIRGGGDQPSEPSVGSSASVSTPTPLVESLGFGLIVTRGERTQELGPGGVLRPDDAVRFWVRVPSPGRVALFHRNGQGRVMLAAPTDEPQAVAEPTMRLELEASITLDAILGSDRFALVHCPQPFDVAAIIEAWAQQPAKGADVPQSVPQACDVAGLTFARRP